MKNKIAVSIFVTILVLQPLIAMVGVGIGFTPIETMNGFTSTQEPGSRLDPGDYTNHVPILIDEANDFVNQGWPGSGTSGDPYIIAGVSIVADLDLVCISIHNTSAYFLIQDCYIEQGSDMAAIDFLNTTHGTIQYTTVNSTGGTHVPVGAVNLYNANNTRVDHVAVYANEHMAYYAQYSTSLTSEFSYFESTNYRAIRSAYGEYITIDNCEFYSWNYYSVYIQYTNYTTVTNSQIYSDTAVSGLAIFDCDFTTITNLYIWSPGDSQGALNIDASNHVDVTSVNIDTCTTGIDIGTCTDLLVQDSSVTDAGSNGIEISNVPFVTLLRCDVTGTIGNGIDITNAPNATISECTTTDVNGRGLRMSSSDNSTIQLCSFTDVGDYGMHVTTSSDLLVEDITIFESSNMGAFFDDCARPIFSNLDISYTMDTALEFSNCPNGSIVDSNIMYSDSNGLYSDNGCDYWFFSNLNIQYTDSYGFYIRDAVECDVVNNYIRYTNDVGFNLDMMDNVTFTDNQAYDCESTGMYIEDSWLAYIVDNHIEDCQDGLYVSSCDNATIMNIEIINAVYTGMDLWSMDYPVISNVDISADQTGIQIAYVYDGIFDNIAIEGAGIHMSAGMIPLQYFDHTFTDVTVNGLDVYYGKHLEDVSIAGGPYGQIILVNCTNFNVTGGSFDYCSTAAHVLFSNHVQLRDMSASHNGYGAYV
ncbi:MAG: right-handed parallel beta-helix repeat-containing protein, partial [Candidatus Thorarchaeota archaeon]